MIVDFRKFSDFNSTFSFKFQQTMILRHIIWTGELSVVIASGHSIQFIQLLRTK